VPGKIITTSGPNSQGATEIQNEEEEEEARVVQ